MEQLPALLLGFLGAFIYICSLFKIFFFHKKNVLIRLRRNKNTKVNLFFGGFSFFATFAKKDECAELLKKREKSIQGLRKVC